MSWSLHPLAWQCKRLASGGIELIKSLPPLMCFKRIYSILWHQTSRFPGRSFPFVSPPRMFELITAKLHTSGSLVWMHANKNAHKKQQPVKAFWDSWLTETQNSDSAEAAGNASPCSRKSPNCTADDLQGQKVFSHSPAVLRVFSHWFPVFCTTRKHVG